MAAPTPKYSVKELEQKIDDYFLSEPDKPTVTGLAYFLGFESRQSMYDYKAKEASSYTIKRAILKIESLHEKNLFGNSPSGSIFWLKNREWSDKQEMDLSNSDGSLRPVQVKIVRDGND
jgi:hypothetical protein